MLAVERNDRPHRDTGGVHVDQQKGDAILLLALAGGAHKTKTHVGPLPVGVPGLLSVDEILVTFALRAGLQRGEVGTRTRLRIALAPPVLAGEDAGKIAFLLRFTAKSDDDRTDHVQAKRRQARGAGGCAFVLENKSLDRGPAGPSVFHRPSGSDPAFLEQDFLPAHVVFLAEAFVLEHFARQVARQMAADEFAHFGAKGGLFLGVVQVHRSSCGIDAAGRIAISGRATKDKRLTPSQANPRWMHDAARLYNGYSNQKLLYSFARSSPTRRPP